MSQPLLTRFRRAVRRAIPRPAPRAAPGSARRSARRAVAIGLVLFGLLTLGLAAAAETVKPEWRDPEYGHRLQAVRRWQRKKPDRPLVVVLGSSRVQMGVSPHAMEFPDQPGSPLVYNLGYRGGFPLIAWLQLMRLLDDGVKPRAVLLVLSAYENKMNGSADVFYEQTRSRYSARDLQLLAPYTERPDEHPPEMRALRLRPWSVRREALVSDLLPNWQLNFTRDLHSGWEEMDRYGWTPFPERVMTEELRVRMIKKARDDHEKTVNNLSRGPISDRALRDLVARCRAERIPVAVAWAPESATYRAMYTARGLAEIEADTRMLTTELGVPVFPAPDHMGARDFTDGYHLLPAGAAKYSRWLADHHLKPWLADALK